MFRALACPRNSFGANTLTMETITLERGESGVATLTLDRPEKLNAANDVMWGELHETFQGLRVDSEVRALVITGAGRGFCSGADLTNRGDGPRKHQLTAMRSITATALALHDLPMPTIAKVNGVAAGAGCNLALGCDLIVASDKARFSEIFASRGLSIDFGGSWLLPRLIGLHKAKELAFFAEVIDAAEAQRLGIVNRVVAHDELDAFVDQWAARLAGGPPLALAQTKMMLNQAMNKSMAEALDFEGASQTINLGSKDTAAAMLAFANKEEPEFHGF